MPCLEPLDNERFLVLAGGDPELLLASVAASRSAPLLQYARTWLSHVAHDFRAEIADAYLAVKAGGSSGLPQWHAALAEQPEPTSSGVSAKATSSRSCQLTFKQSAGGSTVAAEDASGADEQESPLLHKVLLCTAHNLLLLVGDVVAASPHNANGSGGGDADSASSGATACVAHRVLAVEVDSVLGDARRTGPRLLAPPSAATLKCVQLLSAARALERASAVCSVHLLLPALRAALVPGDDGAALPSASASDTEEAEVAEDAGGDDAWGAVRDAAALSASLNEGQRAAVERLGGAISLVQAPPGSGKARLISQALTQRVGDGMRALVCASTPLGVDAIVRELETSRVLCRAAHSDGEHSHSPPRDAGGAAAAAAVAASTSAASAFVASAISAPVLAAGAGACAAGQHATRHTLNRKLQCDSTLVRAESDALVANEETASARSALDALKAKKKAKKGDKGGGGDKGKSEGDEEFLFVSRQAEKLSTLGKAEQPKPARKTPGVTRLMAILAEHKHLATSAKDHHLPSPAKLIEAAQQYLAKPRDDGGDVTAAKLTAAKERLTRALGAAGACTRRVEAAKLAARRRLWHSARVVVCLASEASRVAALMSRDLAAFGREEQTTGGVAADGEAEAAVDVMDGATAELPHALRLADSCTSAAAAFEYVVIDGAASLNEPDTLACLRHCKRAALLVGDSSLLAPSVRPNAKDEAAEVLATSFFSRLLAARSKLGDFGGATYTLTEQARMPPSVCELLSSAFYKGRLRTAGVAANGSSSTSAAHPLPACLVDVGGNESRAAGGSASGGTGCGAGGAAAAYVNDKEASAAVRLALLYVADFGLSAAQVCIVCFHPAQRQLISTKLSEPAVRDALHGTCVWTVGNTARRSADIVIVSCVRAGAAGAAAAAGAGGGLGLLSDPRYVCAALSRCKLGVVVLGSTRCLAIDLTWRTLLSGLKPFASAESHEAALKQSLSSLWGMQLRTAAAAALQLASSHADAEQRAIEALRKVELTEARRAWREAAGIIEPKKLKGWSSDAPATPSPASPDLSSALSSPGLLSPGNASDSSFGDQKELVQQPHAPRPPPAQSPEEQLRAAVASLVEEALANIDLVAAGKRAAGLMATVAASHQLTTLDCMHPTLSTLLAPAAKAEGGKKTRTTAARHRLAAGAAILAELGSGALASTALLAALQACCEAEPALAEIFEHVLLQLYELDGELMPEATVFAWADSAEKAPPGSCLFELHAQSKALVQWLKEAEEEDDD